MSATIGEIYKQETMDTTEKRVKIVNMLTMLDQLSIMGTELIHKTEDARKAWKSPVGK